MANKIWSNFYRRIYKDQTLGGAAIGALIEVGDTVYLKKRVVGGTDVLETVTVTAVGNDRHSIQWDNGTTGVRSEDIVGISAKHQYKCPGTSTINIAITEAANSDVVALAVSDITISGGVFPVNLTESVIADGIEPEFAQALTDVINGYLAGTSGYAAYAITGAVGSQVLTIKITGSVLKPTAITVTGGTAVFS